MQKEPAQPQDKTWRFVAELQTPLHKRIVWRHAAPMANAARLDRGCRLIPRFPDPGGRLLTAHADFRRFLRQGHLRESDAFSIVTDYVKTALPETHRIEIDARKCRILAGDTEGIRRGLVWVEDQMLGNGGPFLQHGQIERRPVIRTRISRCFFGPIHRPPKNRDELTDDINYYPDEYLNRLAHEGVNGLWLTIHFSEICRQSVIREYGRAAGPRLAKLRLTVERCARYGIKIYLFAIEPTPLDRDGPVACAHPELVGHGGGRRCYFCTSNPTAQRYLEEAMRNLFAAVPGLGGLINISIGEGGSHCWSGSLARNTCPRCAPRQPYAVLHDTMAAMERGMRASAPDAECISWPYTQYHNWGDKLTVDAAGRLPSGVILQQNFESAAEVRQCGRRHKLFDYWLSYVGPSKIFADCARAAVNNGNRMFAKLQVGCSHEVATAPFVPVPGHLYSKYRAMHKLGVSGVMQCWYFGNYPGIMTRAAGELAFSPLAASEDEFLLLLARRDWGAHAERVARAWKWFQRGYRNFPANHMFGWYGPMHDAPVWPLHLMPVDQRIAPSWLIASQKTGRPIPASGDRIGECFGYSHTLPEILTLCRRMANCWNRGADIMRRLRPYYAGDRERRLDIGVAEALGIQFESGYNLLRFYALREELPYRRQPAQMRHLGLMRQIVERELVLDARLLGLCRTDSRLGFHSEAEGYKYFPAKIRWRMRQLQALLAVDFPSLRAQIKKRRKLWPTYTGFNPTGRKYCCSRAAAPPAMHGVIEGAVWDGITNVELPPEQTLVNGRKAAGVSLPNLHTSWRACHDRRHLYLALECAMPTGLPTSGGAGGTALEDMMQICIEPRRLWPRVICSIKPDGNHSFIGRAPCHYNAARTPWRIATHTGRHAWTATVRIPLASLREKHWFARPLRIDVQRRLIAGGKVFLRTWTEQHPLESDLGYGTSNPADLGWLLLQ